MKTSATSPAPTHERAGYRRRALVAAGAAAGLIAVLGTPALAVNPESATTTTGQGMEVTIDAPAGPVEPGTTITVGAEAVLDALPPSPVNYVYVVDVSGSMENSSFNPFQDINDPEGIGPEDDCNDDGLRGSAMDAACFGLLSLNQSLGGAAGVSVGLVAFGDGAVTADVNPADGDQALTSPPNVDNNGNGTPDMAEVIRSLDTQYSGSSSAGVGLFTNKISSGFAVGTNYDAALTNMNEIFAAAPEGQDIAAFISDGNATSFSTGEGSPLAAAQAAGVRINTFAIGTIAPGSCEEGAGLRTIADTTGGICTEVDDPSSLSVVFSDVLATRLTNIEVRVNGELVQELSGSEASSLNLSELDVTSYLTEGANEITATAIAADGTTVTASLTLEVAEEEVPTQEPTEGPTVEPTEEPSQEPTATPTPTPTPTPTATASPTASPSPGAKPGLPSTGV